MKIDITRLKLAGACATELERFGALFGTETVEVTEALCDLHYNTNWNWAAEHLLPGPLCDEYERQIAPLCDEYERQIAPLWTEYQRQRKCQGLPPWAEYERQRVPLWTEYQRRKAQVFGRLAEQVT